MTRRRRVQIAVTVLVGGFLVAPTAVGETHGEGGPSASRGGYEESAAYSATPEPLAEVVADEGSGPRSIEGRSRTASVVADSAWSWYMDPRVLTTDRATYFSSVHSSGDVQVTSVDRGTARLRHAVIQPDFEADDHNAPSLTELEDGRIVAFWNAHGLVPAHYRVTLRPGDVTTFGPALELTGSGLEDEGTTYTAIIQLPGADKPYHLFTRRASDDAWVMTTSDDMLTWTPAVRLFDHVDPTSHPYAKFVGTGWGTVHMAFSDTTASAEQRSSLHHVSLSDGIFRRSDGTTIRSLDEVAGAKGEQPRPIEPREATRIHVGRGADGRARPYDIAVDGGEPVVAFTTGNRSTGSWTYRWMRARDGEWTGSTLLRSGTDPAGIALDHGDPRRVVLVDEGEVAEYRTSDDGASWRRRAVSGDGPNRTPVVPRPDDDGSGPVSAAWLSGPYEGFREGAWSTTLRMETEDPAPLDLRATWSSSWAEGGDVLARVTAGVGGPPVAGRTVWLVVSRPGEREEWARSARTGEDGSARLALEEHLPAGSRVRLHVPTTREWGQAGSSPRVVPGGPATGAP